MFTSIHFRYNIVLGWGICFQWVATVLVTVNGFWFFCQKKKNRTSSTCKGLIFWQKIQKSHTRDVKQLRMVQLGNVLFYSSMLTTILAWILRIQEPLTQEIQNYIGWTNWLIFCFAKVCWQLSPDKPSQDYVVSYPGLI